MPLEERRRHLAPAGVVHADEEDLRDRGLLLLHVVSIGSAGEREVNSVRRGGMDAGRHRLEYGCMQLVQVYETLDPFRGALVRGLLESEGIRVLAKGEGTGPYRMGPVILFVDEEDADRARELVSASEAGSLELEAGEEPVLD
jgi:hypothetical protein